MTIIVFRMDDITPDMNWHEFYRYKTMFDYYNIKPLLGVVPDNLDKSLSINKANPFFWSEIRDLINNGWSVAQHGFQHLYVTTSGGILGINKRSEFSSLPYEIQYQKIKMGKMILLENEIQTDIFMPPAHSYDSTTLRVLKDLGFNYVTDGYSVLPYNYYGLRFIPCQMAIPRRIPFGLYTICIHSNTANMRIFDSIYSFIKKNRALVYNFSDALIYPTGKIINRTIEKLVLALRIRK